MVKMIQKLKKFKTPILFFSVLIIICFIIQCSTLSKKLPESFSRDPSYPLRNSITYENEDVVIENQTIMEDIIIIFTSNVSIINSTVQGSIYMFNTGNLNVLQNSSITNNLVISDLSTLFISNSTIEGTIECRDTTIMRLYDSHTIFTKVWKFDSANIYIYNSSIDQLNEFGVAGSIEIVNSQIASVVLNGMPSSRTYISNSNILSLTDLVNPSNVITGPVRFSFFNISIGFSTSERIITLTWIGWDSPIIDGFLNITFQIFLDNQFQAEINGSGLYNQYSGSYEIEIFNPGLHNITIVSIDSRGNQYTSSMIIEMIEYPTFQWIPFFIVIAVIIGTVTLAIISLRQKQNRGYFSSIGTIFKKELADSKKKILILAAIAAAPGIILFFVLRVISQETDSISIDGMRDLIYIFFTLFISYFGLAFSISVGAGAVADAKKNGSLSWFFSKPVRRWEFLWGKIFAFLLIVVITLIATSVSFVIACIFFVEPIYITDILSLGGYIFLIGLAALIPLTAIVVFCSSVFKKTGLAYFIPIMIILLLPSLISFVPILTKHEWPLLFSLNYYYEQLGNAWISNTGGFFAQLSSSVYFGVTDISITPLNLTTIPIVLILSGITIVFLVLSTLIFQKQDLP